MYDKKINYHSIFQHIVTLKQTLKFNEITLNILCVLTENTNEKY